MASLSERTSKTGYRRVLRTIRVMDEHIKTVDRVAKELDLRGQMELADELRISAHTLRTLRTNS